MPSFCHPLTSAKDIQGVPTDFVWTRSSKPRFPSRIVIFASFLLSIFASVLYLYFSWSHVLVCAQHISRCERRFVYFSIAF